MINNVMNNMNIQPNNSKSFELVLDFNTNGLIYYLGTKRRTVLLGLVSVTCCGLVHDSQPVHYFIRRETFRTIPMKHAWFVIDFHSYAICTSHYTLRHYSSWDTEALRNWKIEGGNDGINWYILREHHNDTSLNFKGQPFASQLSSNYKFIIK